MPISNLSLCCVSDRASWRSVTLPRLRTCSSRTSSTMSAMTLVTSPFSAAGVRMHSNSGWCGRRWEPQASRREWTGHWLWLGTSSQFWRCLLCVIDCLKCWQCSHFLSWNRQNLLFSPLFFLYNTKKNLLAIAVITSVIKFAALFHSNYYL